VQDRRAIRNRNASAVLKVSEKNGVKTNSRVESKAKEEQAYVGVRSGVHRISREADLVVDNDVNRAAGRVLRKARECDRLGYNALEFSKYYKTKRKKTKKKTKKRKKKKKELIPVLRRNHHRGSAARAPSELTHATQTSTITLSLNRGIPWSGRRRAPAPASP
jgi:hypothetical protein